MGVTVYGSQQEIDDLVNGTGDLKALIDKGQYEPNGDSYIPTPCVEDYNECFGTNFEKGEIEYDL